MSSGRRDGPAMPDDDIRDAHLRAALHHAPDAQLAPPAAVSAAILREARAAAPPQRTGAAGAGAGASASAADGKGPWQALQRGAARAWAALSHPPLAAGLASVMLASVVGLMWWDRPFDTAGDPVLPSAPTAMQAPARPAGPPSTATAATPTGPAAQATPSLEAEKPTRETSRAKAAPAPARAPLPTASPVPEPALTPAPAPQPSPAQPPAQSPAQSPPASPAPIPAPTPIPPPALPPAAKPAPPPAAAAAPAAAATEERLREAGSAEAAGTARAARLAARDEVLRRATASGTAPVVGEGAMPGNAAAQAAGSKADRAPTAADALAFGLSANIAIAPHRAASLATLSAQLSSEAPRWTWQRSAGPARPVNAELLAWLDAASRASPAAAQAGRLASGGAAGSEADAAASGPVADALPPIALVLLRDGAPQHTLELRGGVLRWQAAPAAGSRSLPLGSADAARLHRALDAATR